MNDPIEIVKAKQAVEEEKARAIEMARIARHVASPAVYIAPTVLTPEKRRYMKRFGSRPKK